MGGDGGPMLAALQSLSRELRELEGITVPVVQFTSLTPLAFSRDFVARNKPVLIQGAIDHWPALTRWQDDESLCSAAGDALITVALTPNGRADAVASQPGGQECFCLPAQRRMRLADFLELLQCTREAGAGALVPYAQAQNDSLNHELPALLKDVDAQLPWATEAFGCPPEALNFWAGDSRSTTSFHRDHYENMFAVVQGAKTMTLLPPSDVWRMKLRRYPVATFRPPGGAAELERTPLAALPRLQLEPVLHCPSERVLWSSVQPGAHGSIACAECAGLEPLRVTVAAGEVLYLPAMWWHQVEQCAGDASGRVLAINWWHNMHFGATFAHAAAIGRLALAMGLNEPGNDEEELPDPVT